MEDRDSLLKDAKSFLGKYSYLSPEDQKIALSAKHPRDLARLAEDNEGLFRSLQAFRKLESEGVISLPQSADSKIAPNPAGSAVGGAVAGVGAIAAIGISELLKDKSYDGYKKSVQKDAEEAAKAWEKEEENLRKENEKLIAQGKKPKERDPDRFTSKEEYIEHHLSASHDDLVLADPKKARKWAQEHPEDLRLSKALDRSQMWNKKLTFEEFEKIRKSYIEKSSRAGATPSETAKLQAKANSELNNLLVRANPELAKSWAIQHGDRGLAIAHNASRQRQIDYAKKNQGRISKLLGRDPAKKFGNEIKLSEPPKPPVATRMTQMAAAGAAVSAPSGGDASWGRPEPIPLPPSMPRPTAIHNTSQPIPNASPISPRRRLSLGQKRNGLPGTASAKKAIKAASFLAKLAAGDPRAWAKVAIVSIGLFILFLMFMFAYLWVNACQIASQYPFGQDLLEAFAKRDCTSDNPTSVPPPPEGVTVVKEAFDADGNKIERIENNKPITYVIKVTYDPALAKVQLTDLILYDRPDYDFDLIEATEPYTPRTDAIGSVISWNLSDHNADGSNNFEFRLKLLPKQTDFKAINRAFFNEEAAPTEDLMEGADSPPTDNTCGGKYNTRNNLNFGDPVCTHTPAKFSAYIREYEKKSKNWEFWEDISIAEGSNPNIGGNINSLGGGGSGTFQMFPPNEIHNHGPGNWPAPNAGHGDVPWQRQIQQAVNYNNIQAKTYTNNFSYWGPARCLCYFESYRNSNKGWCDDIIREKEVRCPYQCYPDYPSNGSCSIYTDRLAKKRGNTINCRQYRCNIGVTGRDANTDKPWK